MKRKGILPAGNITDPARGIFQSDTGEILLNAPEKKMTVVTPAHRSSLHDRRERAEAEDP